MDAWTFNTLAVLALILVILFVCGPIFTIWSLNTIFGLQIPVTFQTWASIVWLMTVMHGIKFQVKKNN